MRGSLRAACTPVALSALFKELQVEGAASFGKAGTGMVEEVLAEGWLKGRLKAGTWLPSIVSRSQQASVSNFYTQNGYIECAPPILVWFYFCFQFGNNVSLVGSQAVKLFERVSLRSWDSKPGAVGGKTLPAYREAQKVEERSCGIWNEEPKKTGAKSLGKPEGRT